MFKHQTVTRYACRTLALGVLFAGAPSLLMGQEAAKAASGQFYLASAATPAFTSAAGSAVSSSTNFMTSSGSSSSSSSSDSMSDDLFADASSLDSAQPPPRRRYGRPNYADSHTNADGSSKFAFEVGGGLTAPVGITHRYNTPDWAISAGGGRNFSRSLAVLLQFDYNNMGLQGATLANQSYIYNDGCTTALQNAGSCTLITNLDGNSHVWSFTLNPTFTLPTEGSLGAYAVAGVGFYHKVTNFTLPTTGEYCDYYYGCYEYTANQVVDHYTSNAPGVNAGVGLTFKFSKFSNERFFVEGRYVVEFDQHKNGYTAFTIGSAPTTATNLYPANSDRTTYVPVTFGLRF